MLPIDPQSLISTIFSIAAKIKEQVDKVKTNNNKCIELVNRINSLEPVLHKLKDISSTEEVYYGQLAKLFESLMKAYKLVSEISSKGKIKRFLKAGEFDERFLAIDKMLATCISDLTFGLTTEMAANQKLEMSRAYSEEIARKAITKDTDDLVELMKKLSLPEEEDSIDITKLHDDFLAAMEQIDIWIAKEMPALNSLSEANAKLIATTQEQFQNINNRMENGFGNVELQQQHLSSQVDHVNEDLSQLNIKVNNNIEIALTQQKTFDEVRQSLVEMQQDRSKAFAHLQTLRELSEQIVKQQEKMHEDVAKLSSDMHRETTHIAQQNEVLQREVSRFSSNMDIQTTQILGQLDNNNKEHQKTHLSLVQVLDVQRQMNDSLMNVHLSQSQIQDELQKARQHTQDLERQLLSVRKRVSSNTSSLPASPGKASKAEKYFKQAYAQAQVGETVGAILSYGRAKDEGHPLASRYRAKAILTHIAIQKSALSDNIREDLLRLAYEDSRECISNDSQEPSDYYTYGILNLGSSNYVDALNAFNKAGELIDKAPIKDELMQSMQKDIDNYREAIITMMNQSVPLLQIHK